MKRVCIVCEGQTEVEFIKTCITPYLLNSQVHAYPTIIRAPSGRHRGGNVTVDRLARFLSHQYDECDYITTFVDFYGFRGSGDHTRDEIETAILNELRAKRRAIESRRVLPYLQMHEFEALLFTNVASFEWVFDGWNDQVRGDLEAIKLAYPNPEDINNSPETAPSKRIIKIFPKGTYSKTEHGPIIAEHIGITAIRNACPQFNAWLSAIEQWGAQED